MARGGVSHVIQSRERESCRDQSGKIEVVGRGLALVTSVETTARTVDYDHYIRTVRVSCYLSRSNTIVGRKIHMGKT